jgi:hypothetical protein|tara:strand:- start:9242 stop:9511 length:270 start_codon:yes stop_codon:yes gene_type:complete
MITEKTYLEMKETIAKHEVEQSTIHNVVNCVERPYLEIVTVETEKKYNPNFGDEKKCKCGHSYHRHFDSYEQMEAIGCKYCGCYDFKEA